MDGPAGFQTGDEPDERQNADGEWGVADDAQPAKRIQCRIPQKFSRAGIPHAVFDAGDGRREPDRQETTRSRASQCFP